MIYSFSLSPKASRLLDNLSELCGLSRSAVLEGLLEVVSELISIKDGVMIVPIYEDYLEENCQERSKKVRGFKRGKNLQVVS